jgi:hypothetical protein
VHCQRKQRDRPYTVMQTKKYKRITKRKLESTSSPNNDQRQPSKESTQHHKQRAVYGRSSVNTTGIVAANKLIKKQCTVSTTLMSHSMLMILLIMLPVKEFR